MNFLAVLDAFAIVVSQPLDQGSEGSFVARGCSFRASSLKLYWWRSSLSTYRESFGFDGLGYRFLVVGLGSIYLQKCRRRIFDWMLSNPLYNKISPAGLQYVLRWGCVCVRVFWTGLGIRSGECEVEGGGIWSSGVERFGVVVWWWRVWDWKRWVVYVVGGNWWEIQYTFRCPFHHTPPQLIYSISTNPSLPKSAPLASPTLSSPSRLTHRPRPPCIPHASSIHPFAGNKKQLYSTHTFYYILRWRRGRGVNEEIWRLVMRDGWGIQGGFERRECWCAR